ncbi:MAG: hypothetical protein HY748_18110 [Elusimicrobia bacterium]|nr:hypothetical protein [Elusimicrobiota bacterium]
MNRTSALLGTALSALLGAAAAAQAVRAPRCADGSEGALNGHPFAPLDCPENLEGVARSGAPRTPESLLARKPEKKLCDPSPLMGRWEGLTVFGFFRYEIFLHVERVKGKSLNAVFQAKNYRTHEETSVHAWAKPRWWKRGWYDARVQLLFWNREKRPIQASLRLTQVPPGSPLAARFDRAALLSYEGSLGEHLVFFKFDGPDRISYRYEDRSGLFSPQPLELEGLLTRSQRETL